MFKRLMMPALLALLGAGQPASAAALRTGVAGTVSQQGCPGPQRIGQGECSHPVAAVRVVLLNAAGKVAASASSGEDGRFTIAAPAGSYLLHAEIDGMYPRCPDVDVTVRKGKLTRADLSCDSGMR